MAFVSLVFVSSFKRKLNAIVTYNKTDTPWSPTTASATQHYRIHLMPTIEALIQFMVVNQKIINNFKTHPRIDRKFYMCTIH